VSTKTQSGLPADSAPAARRMEHTVPTPVRVPSDEGAAGGTAQSTDMRVLLEQLAVLRGDLERTLADVEALTKVAQLFAGEQLAQELIEQLRDAARHIENGLDELMPPAA
jgi:hypothetical protein